MRTAAALLYSDALATSITLPMEILHAASQLASVARRGKAQGQFRLLSAAEDGRITLSSGLALSADGQLEDAPPMEMLILPAIWRSPDRTLKSCANLLPELRRRQEQGTLLCSVGTASCLLAEAGLLSGRSATTHWNYFDRFEKRYPDVHLKRRHLITQSGNIFCVGSVNSIADLMVHVVELWYGKRIARAVENQFSPEIRRTFQTAAFLEGTHTAHHDELILEAQMSMQEQLSCRKPLKDVARDAGLGMRSFTRRFRRATGMSPLQYAMQLRVNEAKSLLLHSNLDINEIAWRCGWPSASLFSRQFRLRVGMPPRDYRAAVRGKRFIAGDKPPSPDPLA